jgi:rhodanese-related sulfurtransferase
MSIAAITVEELSQRMKSGDNIQLLDVREPGELRLASLNDFVNLPLSEFDQWSSEILLRFDPHAETLVMCHHGMRSAQMCQWLISQGFTNVKNITGGIDAYSIIVDPSIPQY